MLCVTGFLSFFGDFPSFFGEAFVFFLGDSSFFGEGVSFFFGDFSVFFFADGELSFFFFGFSTYMHRNEVATTNVSKGLLGRKEVPVRNKKSHLFGWGAFLLLLLLLWFLHLFGSERGLEARDQLVPDPLPNDRICHKREVNVSQS